jgi:high-affinity Fe2+/Pb2+ permease
MKQTPVRRPIWWGVLVGTAVAAVLTFAVYVLIPWLSRA